MTRRLRKVPLPLAILLALAALQGAAWSVATAPFQGPDEIAHFSYVQNLAERGNAPAFGTGDGASSTEVGAALLWSNLLSTVGVRGVYPGTTSADKELVRRVLAALAPGSRLNAGGPNAVAKNPPLYYLYEDGAYRVGSKANVFNRLFLMRLWNVVLFLGAVLFAWLAAAELFRDTWRRTAVCGFVALQPELAFLSGAVNPDSMLAVVWAAFVFAGLRLLMRGPTFWRVFGLLATVVASSLTQGRGLPLIPAGLFVVALALWRHRPVRLPSVAGIGAGVILAGLALVVYKATLGPSSSAYGAEIAFHGPRSFGLWEFVSQTWQFYLPKIPGMRDFLGPDYTAHNLWGETMWGTFGSLDVTFPSWVYNLVEAGLIALVIGLILGLINHRRTLRWDVAAFLAITFAGLLVFLHLASYRNLLGSDDPLLVGRYLMPLLVPIGIVVVFALGMLPRRVAVYGMTAVLVLEAMLGLSGLGLSIARFYG